MAAVLNPRFTPVRTSAGPRRVSAILVAALHLVAVLALLSYAPAREALIAAAPIMVELIAPPKVEPKPAAPTEPPRPRPVSQAILPPKAAEPAPVVIAPSTAPGPATVTPTLPTPAPEPVAAALATVPLTPPVFNAAYLDNPAPAYPALSRRMREQGQVTLRVLVNASGTADEVQVRSTSGAVRLDTAAVETVKRWKFVPARRGAEPVPAWVLIPVSFRLEG